MSNSTRKSTQKSPNNRGWPPDLREGVTALVEVVVRSSGLFRHWKGAEIHFANRDPLAVSPEELSWKEPELSEGDSAESIKTARRMAVKDVPRRLRRTWEKQEYLYWAVHTWRAAIDHAVSVLPLVEKYADDPRDPLIKRWTTCTRSELRDLAAFIHRDMQDDMPRLGQGVPLEFAECAEKIRGRLEELKAIETADVPETEANSKVDSHVAGPIGNPIRVIADLTPGQEDSVSEREGSASPKPDESAQAENKKLTGRSPKRYPEIETKPVYPGAAAKIFRIGKRAFLVAVDEGKYAVRWSTDRKLCLDLDEVVKFDPVAAKRLDPSN